MKIKLFFLLSFWIICLNSKAQENIRSIRSEEQQYYNNLGFTTNKQFDAFNNFKTKASTPEKSNCVLNKIVFGYHPYWSGSKFLNYRWNLLSDLCFFSYEVDSLTGNAISTHNWATDTVIDTAQAHGVRVHLCVTLFEGHAYFFSDTVRQHNLITNLINAVQLRNANGVNIDFEGVPSSQKTNLTAFLKRLCNRMHAAIPGSKVSIAAPSVNWSGTFEIATLNNYLDWFIIMGYDYYWGGSAQAGPVAGLYSMTCGSNDNISQSITSYLKAGASANKLVLALPYYGREWHTTSNSIPGTTIAGTSVSRTFEVVNNNVSGNYSLANRHWETNSMTPYYLWTDGTWHQCFVDDARSFGKRLDMINIRGIAGTGMWALGYDDGYSDLWDKIEEKLTSCAVVPCTDTIYDLGGPGCSYFNNEQFVYTISPTDAVGLSLTFDTLNLESGYDSLWIYNGPSITSPLLGKYSGTTNPGTVTAGGGSMTLKFYSDNATVRPGWRARWNCATDNIPPATSIAANVWETQDFNATFTDLDNIQVGEKFYQVMDFNGTEWRGNSKNGFFNDNFNTTIHPDWHNKTGVWSINSARLNQTDEAQANSNIYAHVAQAGGKSYLYHWQMNIGGSGANRRAGIHFFCDNADSSNRNNSYMVYYRPDQDKVQIYKYINNVMYLKTDDDCVINPATWYDCKVFFNQQTGLIKAYLNDVLVSLWTDASPNVSGNSVSLRTGNCNALFDDVKVYTSRNGSALITVGDTLKDVRYQNTNPALPSCRIKSIVSDIYNNISSPGSLDVNIDWTVPSAIVLINDGTAADIDTSADNTSLSGNWSASTDVNSGIAQYYYSGGNTAGGTDVFSWLSAGTGTSAVKNGLSLTSGNIYYFNVKSLNGAGLESAVSSSDGVLIDIFTSLSETQVGAAFVSPNPFGDFINLNINIKEPGIFVSELYDFSGKKVACFKNTLNQSGKQNFVYDISGYRLSRGIYLLKSSLNNTQLNTFKIVHAKE